MRWHKKHCQALASGRAQDCNCGWEARHRNSIRVLARVIEKEDDRASDGDADGYPDDVTDWSVHIARMILVDLEKANDA